MAKAPHKITSIGDIFDIWPTVVDMSVAIDVAYTTVHSWKRRGFIPPRYWHKIVKAASKTCRPLSLLDCARVNAGAEK